MKTGLSHLVVTRLPRRGRRGSTLPTVRQVRRRVKFSRWERNGETKCARPRARVTWGGVSGSIAGEISFSAPFIACGNPPIDMHSRTPAHPRQSFRAIEWDLTALRCLGRCLATLFCLLAFDLTTLSAKPVFTSVPAPRQVVTLGESLTLNATASGQERGDAQPSRGSESLTLNATASGDSTLAYQWKRNGRAISGATSDSYTLTNASPIRDGGWYQVVATDSTGSTTSATIFVNVATIPQSILTWGFSDWLYGPGETVAAPELSSGTGIVSLAVGAYYYGDHMLALKADGTVVGWGLNDFGQATPPADLKDVVAISGGGAYSMALKADGTVVAWGASDALIQSLVSLTDVAAVSAGYGVIGVLKSDGTVATWNRETGFVELPELSDATAIAAGGEFIVALKSDGTVAVWMGDRYYYEDPGKLTDVPAGLTDVVAIAAGWAHAVAVKADGTVVAWGYNNRGQTQVPAGLANVVAASACQAGAHTIALKTDGTVVAWGDNYAGQSNVPVGLDQVVGIAAGSEYSLALRASAAPFGSPSSTPTTGGGTTPTPTNTSTSTAGSPGGGGAVSGWFFLLLLTAALLRHGPSRE
jgi:hypothetical protein